MIAVLPGGGDAGGRWRMVARTPTGADVVARVGRRPAEPAEGGSWRQSLERLRDGDGELSVVATGDGHLKWTLTDPDGTVVAESPPVHRDEDSCRRAFAAARQSAQVALGGGRRRAGGARTGGSGR